MPSPRSKGPNTCPVGIPGVCEYGSLQAWICSEAALSRAFEEGGIEVSDWVEGTYPPDFESILAFEV